MLCDVGCAGGVFSHGSMTPKIQDVMSDRRMRVEDFQLQLQNILIQGLNSDEKRVRCADVADRAFKAAIESVKGNL